MPRPLPLIIILVLALGACGGPGAQAPTAAVGTPAGAAPPATTALAPAQTEAPAAASPTGEPAPTAEPPRQPRPTNPVTPLLPPAPPQITPRPTVAPSPLEAGWWDGAVCYEVFVRSFYDSDGDGNGDLNGLIQKLDYINDGDPDTRSDLGANCIWLMPVAEAASYHGYDTTDYYTVEADYGTNEDFKRLVEEAEARGIKVVIDLVLNHTSSQHPWFQEALRDPGSPYRDWYLWAKERPRYQGPWGQRVWHPSPAADEFYYGVFWSEMPDLNYRNPAVTEEAQRISRFWLEEMGVAGFRMDAIKHMVEYQVAQADTIETHNWLRDYRAWLAEAAPGAYTIGEIFGATPADLQAYYPDQMDYYFVFSVGEAIRDAILIGESGRYVAAVDGAYGQLPFQRWAPFLTNHDQDRIMSQLGDDPAKAKLAALALLTLPGQPYVYYGEELGMLGVKPDEDIRTPMQWTKEEMGGFTAGIPWRQPQPDYPVKNVMAQEADPDSLLNLYRELIHLHVATPALATGDYTALASDSPGVAAFLRQSGDDRALVVINFGEAAADVTLTAGPRALPAGSYTLETLLGAPDGDLPPLEAGADGAVELELAVVPAQTGFVFRLAP